MYPCWRCSWERMPRPLRKIDFLTKYKSKGLLPAGEV